MISDWCKHDSAIVPKIIMQCVFYIYIYIIVLCILDACYIDDTTVLIIQDWIMVMTVTVIKTTRTTKTPAFWGYPLPPHDYPYYWVILDPKSKEDKVKITNLNNLPKFQIYQFWNKLCMQHTFWSCLIRCANRKWIWRVLLKMPVYQYTPLLTSLKQGV